VHSTVLHYFIFSSASIYPACFAPYAMVTACTDNTVRFWRCKLVTENKSKESTDEYLRWEEWQMISKEGTSLLSISGTKLKNLVVNELHFLNESF